MINSGNKCGHLAKTPRFPVSTNPRKPDILNWASQNARQYYFEPAKFLPRLRQINGSSHQQRSERREAIVGVIQVLLDYTDLISFEVGTPTRQGVVGIQISFITEKTGFSPKRVYRALRDIKNARYIDMRWKRCGIHDRYITVRWIKLYPRFFHDLGISHLKLENNRHWKRKSFDKSKREERKNDPAVLKAQAKAINDLAAKILVTRERRIQEGAKRFIPPSTGDPPAISRKRLQSSTTQAQRENNHDQMVRYMEELLEKQPHTSFEERTAMVREKFPLVA